MSLLYAPTRQPDQWGIVATSLGRGEAFAPHLRRVP